MKTPYPRPGAEKPTTQNPMTAILGGMMPLDIHAPVRAVRFAAITSYLTDILTATVRGVAWEQQAGLRLASMTSAERGLITAALWGHSSVPKFTPYDWLGWDDAQRSVEVTEMVEAVTRLYVVHYLKTIHGRKLDPYRTAVINLIQTTRFCSEG